jgi:hypothetical protein
MGTGRTLVRDQPQIIAVERGASAATRALAPEIRSAAMPMSALRPVSAIRPAIAGEDAGALPSASRPTPSRPRSTGRRAVR